MSAKSFSFQSLTVGLSEVDHGSLGGLSDDDHAQYVLAAGRSGGQTIVGGTGAGEDLVLQSTSDSTPGTVQFKHAMALQQNSPAQITSNQDDYAPGSKSFLRLSTDASRTITGITGGEQGYVLIIANVGSFDLVLAHEGLGSSSSNRFLSESGSNITLNADDLALLVYDGTTLRWRATKLASGGGGGYSPGGTDVALADGGTGASLADPGADRILFWDDSATSMDWLSLSGASISGTTLTVTSQAGRYLGTTVINAGTTTFTTGASTTKIRVRVQAGGGAGGGSASGASAGGCGGGGSAGGYAEKTFTVAASTGYTCAVGTGGTAGAAGNNPGGDGNNSTFAVGATTVTANGGKGGTGMAAAATPGTSVGGASPAVSTNGDVNSGGAPGGFGLRASATILASGAGGSCLFGAGGNSRTTQGTGLSGVGYGAGGGGGTCVNAGGAVAGFAGLDGVIVVDEFS